MASKTVTVPSNPSTGALAGTPCGQSAFDKGPCCETKQCGTQHGGPCGSPQCGPCGPEQQQCGLQQQQQQQQCGTSTYQHCSSGPCGMSQQCGSQQCGPQQQCTAHQTPRRQQFVYPFGPFPAPWSVPSNGYFHAEPPALLGACDIVETKVQNVFSTVIYIIISIAFVITPIRSLELIISGIAHCACRCARPGRSGHPGASE